MDDANKGLESGAQSFYYPVRGTDATALKNSVYTKSRTPSGSEITNPLKTTLPAEMYYPLELATKLVQKYYPAIDLLSYANQSINQGKISLLVAVPKDVDVYTVDKTTDIEVHKWPVVPDMFVLGMRESYSLLIRNKDGQCDFRKGYSFSSGQPEETHPYDNAPEFQLEQAKKLWVWRTLYKGSNQPCDVKITRDCLFVLHSEVAKQFPLIEIGDQPEERHKDSQHQDGAALKSENKAEELFTKLVATTTTTPTPAAKVNADKNKPETKKLKSNGEPCVIEDQKPEDNRHEQEQAIENQETMADSNCPPAKKKSKKQPIDKSKIIDDKCKEIASADNIHPSLKYFADLPDDAFVQMDVVTALFGCSISTVERRTKAGILKKHSKGVRDARWNVGELREVLKKDTPQ